MPARPRQSRLLARSLAKCPTGIQGLDEITGGGLPRGRPTLVCGNAGCGKTLMAMEFLVRGATEFGEPGVFMSFEENEAELTQNFASLGFDLDALAARKKISLDFVYIERSEIEETGDYDLEGLFVRLDHAIKRIGAKRVVLDTIEALFGALPNENVLRAELRRLFRWLKARGVTVIITGERGENTFTRHGIEEYVSDCVISLEHELQNQVATRSMRILKYRGTVHGTNQYPFLITDRGISVLPVTSLTMDYPVSAERISTGIPRLDAMFGGKGLYRGTSILVSGTAGTGKTSMSGHFVDAACRRGERCVYFAFEESSGQIIRNLKSIGLDLGQWVKRGLLRVVTSRPTRCGLEMHLAEIEAAIRAFDPRVVVVDPITNLTSIGTDVEIKSTLTRLIDQLKLRGITAVFTSLTEGGGTLESSTVGVSSLMDTWIVIRAAEAGGERNRALWVLKSRGMAHSNQVREYLITPKGIQLTDVYIEAGEVLMGTARAEREAQAKVAEAERREEVQRKKRAIQQREAALASQVAALEAERQAQAKEFAKLLAEEHGRTKAAAKDREQKRRLRQGDAT